MLTGENGIITQAKQAKENSKEAEAREKLEITFEGAKIEKASNPKYNQEDYLDSIMTKEIKDIKILDNIVIVDGYAFEIDRSVPKVGRYVGKEGDFTFPNVTVSDVLLINDDKQAKFTITAQEEKKGIKKIEVWLDGKKIDEHDENYNNVTTQITKECTVNKNGIYTVKVYGELTISKTVEVQGIISSVSFEPNGDPTYKKAHTTKITLEGASESIASIKYAWIRDDGVNEPTEDKFTEVYPNGGIITGTGYTGKYYLWVLLKTVTGKKNICVSEAFYFDNEGPIINVDYTSEAYTSIKVTGSIIDEHSGVLRYIVGIDGEPVKTVECSKNKSVSINMDIPCSYGEHEVSISTDDALENGSTFKSSVATLEDVTSPVLTNANWLMCEDGSGSLDVTLADEMGVRKIELGCATSSVVWTGEYSEYGGTQLRLSMKWNTGLEGNQEVYVKVSDSVGNVSGYRIKCYHESGTRKVYKLDDLTIVEY